MKPSRRFVNFLTLKYKIGKSFKNSHFLLEELSLTTSRYFNADDFCSILTNSFKIKISKKKISYFDQNLIKKEIFFKHVLSFKFVVLDEKTKY